jgi:deoxyribodipyrimidine photo-lyase
MKQLISTGWMHNRGRMIVASFLTKDLLIDWRMGEKWFMEHLIDGDPASNVGGWQWTAGCGVDAAPYFRVFNPVLQSKRFDPEASFIKKWIPDLATVDIKFAHEPWLSTKSRYIPRMIDHSESKKKILNLFKSYNE